MNRTHIHKKNENGEIVKKQKEKTVGEQEKSYKQKMQHNGQ